MRLSWVLAGIGVVAVAADAVLFVRGIGGFATHPISALSLAAAGTATGVIATSAPDRTRVWLQGLAIALTSYLALGTWASVDPNMFAVALWAVAWVPVTGLITVVGLAAAGARRVAVTLAVAIGALTIGGAAVAEPVDPFRGVAPATSESWASRVTGATDLLTVVFVALLVGATILMVVRVARARPAERRQTITCAAVTAGGPGLVLICLALAVLADPGDVDPASGSVAYIVAIAGTGVLTAHAVVSFSKWALRAILASWMASIAVLLGIALSPVIESHAALGTLAVVAVVVVCITTLIFAVRVLESWAVRPRLQMIGGVVPGLSPRENEVLAMVADGATNAGIAASLFLSERTVEQHLRSVFTKLHLGPSDGSNRRVRAAAIWWQHHPATGSGTKTVPPVSRIAGYGSSRTTRTDSRPSASSS
jgi:DNA-binding CsgD family transcriptional regulator